jgi:hypothetical protein
MVLVAVTELKFDTEVTLTRLAKTTDTRQNETNNRDRKERSQSLTEREGW